MPYTRMMRRRRRGANNLALLRMRGMLRRTGRRGRSGRIFKRFIRRSAPRPELKWVTIQNTTQYDNASGRARTVVVTPTTIGQGAGIGNRIGNQIKFVKVDLSFYYQDDTLAAEPSESSQSYYVRRIVWTPRVDFTTAQTYMEQNTILSPIDFNQVTVLHDSRFKLGRLWQRDSYNNAQAGYVGPTNATVHNTGPDSCYAVKRFSVKHPRNVKFAGNTLNDIDDEKYSMYVTHIVNGSSSRMTQFNYHKTWYFDS